MAKRGAVRRKSKSRPAPRPSRKSLENTKALGLERRLTRQLGYSKSTLMREALGNTRFNIVASNYLKAFKGGIKKREALAEAKTEKILSSQKIPKKERFRIRIENLAIHHAEQAGIIKGKRGWYTVFIAGKRSKKIHGEKAALSARNRLDHIRHLEILQKRYDFTRKEAEGFTSVIRKAEYAKAKALRNRASRIKDPKRRAKALKALGVRGYGRKAMAWQIQFLIRVLGSE